MFGLALVAAEEISGQEPSPISFSSQNITSRLLPTQLEFGPDGRLYVAELDGPIYAFTIERDDETGDYSVTATEVIDLIQTIPNHNDDGTPFSSTIRNVTGMITAGTADNPVLYVSSSDPRIDDPQADTNSGIVSRLTWTGTEWTKLDLVRSLPRSAHDHLPNGLALDAANGTLYLALGGHTNMGAPSFSFKYLPEYALSAAILSIDLDAIGEQTYDIPTLKGDVFGGQAGNNQAMIVPGGPVQVHSPGFRNAYDVLLTTAGRLYTFDNDSNEGWGGLPVNEGPGGTCTNDPNESGSATHGDNLHLITGPGYYGGHPNPTRANRSNTFDGLSPIPEGLENPVECEFLIPGVEDGALAVNSASTNGLAEYTASNFEGQMTGNILATAYDGTVMRFSLNSSGDQVIEQNDLFTSLEGPLGVTAQGDDEPFPGTIWVGQFFNGDITVFEPQDFSECDPDTLDPDATSPNGYTYGDLIDNGLDPCNPAQVPPDFDQDFVSDLNDSDIDGDGISNDTDLFDFDAANGRGNPLPHGLAWVSDVVGTLGGMAAYKAPGFTGLMAHPTSPVSVFDQFNPDKLIPGGAAGIFTVEVVTPGDAQLNTQENAFHFGVDVHGGSGVFTAQTRILSPFAGAPPQDNQSMGLQIGQGDQDNYIKLVTNANGGDGGLLLAGETQGDFNGQQVSADILGADYVDLFLVIDPAASTVAASYAIARDGAPGPRTAAGRPIAMPASWLSDATNGLAVGIISTSSGADPFPVNWEFVDVYEGTGDDFPAPGHLDADPLAVVFPETLVGDTAFQTVTLGNSGETALEINDAAITGDQVFITDLALPQTLEPGATQEVSVSFTPDVATAFEAVLALSHDGGNSPLQVSMNGEGAEPASIPVPDPGQFDFGGIVVGSASEPELISVTNSGPAPVVLGTLGIGAGDAGDFSLDVAADNCSGVELDPGQSCSFTVQFQPTQTGARDAQVDIPSSAGDTAVSLQGQGLIAIDLNIDAGPNPAVAGEPLDYTLAVGNLANAQAENVALTFTLPPDTVLLAIDGCQQESVSQPACTIGQIPANGSIEVTVTVDVSSSVTGSLQFAASANADSLNEAVAVETTTPVAIVNDLTLAIAGDAVAVDTDTMALLYLIIVTNTGPSDAVSALVTTELPAGLDNVEWTCQPDAAASCTGSGVGEIDDLADLPAGASVTYQIEATAPSALVTEGISMSSEVAPSGESTDPNPDNNSDSVMIATRIFHDSFEANEG
ncbi:choice-of-anchor D domain-containing protein [Wenzhouxiangella sp. EGI_FJ10305]|uniref:choice-of-anchor D domain-containing protein n=1 Tax=Wenzhouxiangella sp. EGI_FJ10305 TaxID=3243768 RepID=UPI0035E2E6C5